MHTSQYPFVQPSGEDFFFGDQVERCGFDLSFLWLKKAPIGAGLDSAAGEIFENSCPFSSQKC